jgi:hypothetical protein
MSVTDRLVSEEKVGRSLISSVAVEVGAIPDVQVVVPKSTAESAKGIYIDYQRVYGIVNPINGTVEVVIWRSSEDASFLNLCFNDGGCEQIRWQRNAYYHDRPFAANIVIFCERNVGFLLYWQNNGF